MHFLEYKVMCRGLEMDYNTNIYFFSDNTMYFRPYKAIWPSGLRPLGQMALTVENTSYCLQKKIYSPIISQVHHSTLCHRFTAGNKRFALDMESMRGEMRDIDSGRSRWTSASRTTRYHFHSALPGIKSFHSAQPGINSFHSVNY